MPEAVRVRLAPGMRVEIRDAEWRIKRIDHASDGGHVLACEGLSELVRGREGVFLSKLEQVTPLDPESTRLVDDASSNFGASLLFIDSLLRQATPSDKYLHQGHKGALDTLNFQYQPALQALRQPRQRILIADSVGLGKTLEAGMLTAELIARGRGKRILVLAVKSMLAQFQQEFWNRFTIPLVRLDSVGLQRVRKRVPTNHNPFHYFDKSIISIDTLKQDIEYRHHLEQAYWDIIIIDEAHNVADRGSGSQRARLAKLLATRSDTLIMLSATPHDGKPESFASLVNMLDPTAIANPHDYAEGDFHDKGLVIRRFKKDVRDELAGQFPDRETSIARRDASPAEEAAYASLMDVEFHTLDGHGNGVGQLFRTTLEKALFSSPAACLSTVQKRIAKLERRISRSRDEERRTTLVEDAETLRVLAADLEAIPVAAFSKYQLLLDVIANDLGWQANSTDDRLVIFTESLITLAFLEQHLPRALKLKSKQLAVLNGKQRDRDLMQTVEDFNRSDSPIRLLLASDVASEGINLHHLSHRMIHFDIPWSLMVFQQRNGRIDRYGQSHEPQIRYLLTESGHARVRGDQRVLELLIEKDEQAGKNIGDPSEFMGLFDRDAEEERVAEVMEGTEGDFDLGAAMDALMRGAATEDDDPLAAFTPEPSSNDTAPAVVPLPHVFEHGLDYARAAIQWLRESGQDLNARIEDGVLSLTAPPDLVPRLRYLPKEARPEHDHFVLSPDPARVNDSIRRSLQDDDTPWAGLHYLWPLHPVMQWLADRALNAFGRHTAPVLRLPGKLAPGQHVVLVHGGFPNRRGQLLVQGWVGVAMQGAEVDELLGWDALQQRLDLYPGKLANPGRAGDTESLQALLPAAVEAACQHLLARKQAFEATHAQPLAEQKQRLARLKARHQHQLEADLGASRQQQAVKAKRRANRQKHIDRVFADHENWLHNSQSIEDKPYLQVVAVFTGTPAREDS